MFLIRLLEVLLPAALILGVIGFGAYRFVKVLEGLFGVGAGPDRELVASATRAREVAARIQRLLPECDPQHPSALHQELEELVERRLPTALDRQRKLLEHLGSRSAADLVKEERDLSRKLGSSMDPELRTLLKRNLDLLRERIVTLERLELASRKADAQIRAVLINLEAFEDRLVASEYGKVAGADLQIEALVEDVKLLEAAYDELQLEA